jgi:CheY-like chemotaxis protein
LVGKLICSLLYFEPNLVKFDKIIIVVEPTYAILCVDDDPMINVMLSFQLRKIINNETTIVECLSKPEDVEYHVSELVGFGVKIIFILVDYQMPKLNGAELIRKLKLTYPDLICVMLSGQANDIVVEKLFEDKLLTEFISKPWEEEKLFALIQPYLPGTDNSPVT